MIQARPIFDRLTALADPTRSRLLLLLDRHELTVGELCSALQLPQSTVSRHLKTLADEGWVIGARRGHEPALHHARLARSIPARGGSGSSCATRSAPRRRRGRISCAPNACCTSDARRRRRSSRHAPDSGIACAPSCTARAPTSRRSPRCSIRRGSSAISAAAPGRRRRRSRRSSRSVIAVDESSAMLAAARKRVGHHDNVELRSGRLEDLPIDDASLDVAVLSLVLHFVVDPAAVHRRSGARAAAGRRGC